jgi:hypothetical protein
MEKITMKRTHKISVFYNDNEYNTLVKKHKISFFCDKNISSYIRAASLDNVPVIVPFFNREAWRDLANLSNNLNQIARISNAKKYVEDIDFLRSQIAKLRNILIGKNI